jgi:hypothetical protein
MSEVTETLVLRLTDAQVAIIMRRIERRKKRVGGCAQIDLGDVSFVSSDLSGAKALLQGGTRPKRPDVFRP